jgi:hypothetical protein
MRNFALGSIFTVAVLAFMEPGANTRPEANETFFVALRPTNGAGVRDGLATGTIANDAGGRSSQDLNARALGDVNGDGAIDIIGFGPAGVDALSNGFHLTTRRLQRGEPDKFQIACNPFLPINVARLH